MRKAFTLILVLVLCMTMALPVFAASAGGGTGTGAPGKVSYSSMMLVDANGNVLVEAGHDCITMVKSSDDALLNKLPAKAADKDHKYLYDITLCEKCEELLKVEGNSVALTFKMDVKKSDDVVVMAYKNDAWTDIQKVEVKNGEVVCTFAGLCPVVFATNAGASATLFGNPRTGDIIMMWVAIMLVALGAIAGAVVIYRKKFA